VHEKFERGIKWLLRGIAAVGIVISGFSFQAWYIGVGVAILILIVQQVFERTLFEYTAIHVAPMPTHYDRAQWAGVGFAFSESGQEPDIVGPAFEGRDYAEEILSLIRSWNYGRDEDPDDFVRLSFIIEDSESYSVYFYPASRRPSAKRFFDEYEAESKEGKHGKRLMRLSIAMTFCKSFPREGSLLPLFDWRNNSTGPFLFTTFFKSGDRFIPLVDGAILKFRYKHCGRSELTKIDHEFMHGGPPKMGKPKNHK